jgi:hypothetical protein
MSNRRMFAAMVAAALLAVAGVASAERAEEFAVPTFREPGKLQFKVKEGPVTSISVMVTTHANGRTDRQILELHPSSDIGPFATEPGYRMWETDFIAQAMNQWGGARHTIGQVEFSYITHVEGADRQRRPIESEHRYQFAGPGESTRWFQSAHFPVLGPNGGRRLDHLDPHDVQAAVDRLAARSPEAHFVTLPGGYPHPLHAENQLIEAFREVIAAKRRDPGGHYFIRGTIYNHDSEPMSHVLAEAHRVGVEVQLMTDWVQTTPHRSSKPAFEILRGAGVETATIIRGAAGGQDRRSSHTKLFVMGKMGSGGRIEQGTTFDMTFNTEFGNWPKNQEGMTVFPNNRDVATVYNHLFQAMKGNAPLRLVVHPESAQFILTHSMYPLYRADGRTFTSRDAASLFISKAREELLTMDLMVQDRGVAHELAEKARSGTRVDALLNGFMVAVDGEAAHSMNAAGVNVHTIDNNSGGSPIHHKAGVARNGNDYWVRGGSLNLADYGFHGSDDTMYVTRNTVLAHQVLGAANRLLHNQADYRVVDWRGERSRPDVRWEDVDIETVLSHGAASRARSVQFEGTGSWALHDRPVELHRVGPAEGGVLYRGTRALPSGFVHRGNVAVIHDGGHKEYGSGGDHHFESTSRCGRVTVRVRSR